MKKIQLKELLTKISTKINFQELLIKITQDKNKLTLTIIIISIIFILDLFLGLRFQARALGRVSSKTVALRKDLKDFNSDLIKMQRQKRDLTTGQAKRMLSAGEIPWVIEEISRLANQQAVGISQIRAMREPPEDAKNSRKSLKSKKYSSSLIGLEVSAGYHQLGRFLTELKNHPVFLAVEKLDIRRVDEDSFEHKINLILKTYVSKK